MPPLLKQALMEQAGLTGRRYDAETETLIVLPQTAGTLCASGAGTNRPAGMASETDLIVCQPIAFNECSEAANPLLAKGNLSYRGDMDKLVCSVDCRNLYENKELSGTLQAKQGGGYSLNYQNPVRIGYLVRRFTPVECERLQGLVANYTAGGSDYARYKAIGNSMAKPCPKFIIRNIARIGKAISF